MKRFFITLFLLALSVTDAHATITLPFSTTYNCAEIDQSNEVWATGQNICDGLRKSGDWTTSNGGKESITSAANYSGGAGGRGQRHLMGQSSGDTNGSGGIDFAFNTSHTELYIRFYTRYEAGIKLGGDSAPILRATKVLYFFFGCGEAGGCGVFDIEGSNLSLTIAGDPYYSSPSFGWDDLFGGGVNVASDGRWMCHEIYVKGESTPTANDGIAQWSIDGTMRFNHNTLDWKGNTGWGGFNLPENGQFTIVTPSVDMYQDFDDVAIQTTGPIGCLGGGAPATPTGFKAANPL